MAWQVTVDGQVVRFDDLSWRVWERVRTETPPSTIGKQITWMDVYNAPLEAPAAFAIVLEEVCKLVGCDSEKYLEMGPIQWARELKIETAPDDLPDSFQEGLPTTADDNSTDG